MCQVIKVADYFIRQADTGSGDVMTHLKLQKLLYFAQGHHLALFDKPLFADRIEAWAHGPVCPAIWQVFKVYGYKPIPASVAKSDIDSISRRIQGFLAEVWRVYGQFTAKRLEEMTHDPVDSPWRIVRGNLRAVDFCHAEISKAKMQSYFSTLNATS